MKHLITWGELVEGRLIRRYKRFLADVELLDGSVVTAHTANTGRMLACSEPGRPVWLSRQNGPKRKYPYTWELIKMPDSLVGVNTSVPNLLTARAAEAGLIPELPHPARVRREAPWGAHTRFDLEVEADGQPPVMVEIKNCSLAENGRALFPDAVTARGTRHLDELAELAGAERRAMIFILVQRHDARVFSPADRIDPAWGRALRRALAAGVELVVRQARLDLTGAGLGPAMPVEL